MTEDYKFDSKVVQQFSNEYQNHGMLKWQVFYLSDQTSKLNKSARQQYETEHRQHSKEMTREAINHIIKNALLKHLPVKVKLNEIFQDHIIPPSIEGKIKGFYQNRLVIENTNQLIDISNIYAISIIYD
ncbi:hypothetical protein JG30_12460 (plasmid) [Bombilactobacillus mellifer]|uniref:DNA-directed RNA polymerase beta subunit n=1 Tax=Bombilactobacillus mellifer TaxID=1218492 RepID=A0A0F4LMD2_9LACO|nr:hypothetical protein [Bombilactobacillus mellifer]KJY59750.1 hypothetical protein JG30_12460 [Bombilactobacillus mellifer]